MNNTILLVTFLGLIASAGFISSNYVITRKWILILQGIGMAGVGSMFAVRAVTENIPSFWGVTAVNALFLVRNIWLYFREKHLGAKGVTDKERVTTTWVFMFIILTTYLAVTPIPSNWSMSFDVALFILPFVAAITNVLGVGQSKIIRLKWFILLSVSSWLAFDILVGAWQTLIGDTFSAIALIISLYRVKQNSILKP